MYVRPSPRDDLFELSIFLAQPLYLFERFL
jgi:hypothetical protein